MLGFRHLVERACCLDCPVESPSLSMNELIISQPKSGQRVMRKNLTVKVVQFHL